MLRINPMLRRRLADLALAALVEELVELERSTAALAETASDDLYRLVPTVPEGARGRLLRLRRDIHNDRPPPNGSEHDLPASVAAWVDHRHRRVACRCEIRRSYGDALARERDLLRAVLADENFLTTLAQSAPGVYDDACRYRQRGTADSKDRKAERALLQYVTRAMVRTSPYGRFTAVGLAEPGPAGTAMDEAAPDTATSHVEVDRALFDYVVAGLEGRDGQAGDPRVSLAPTARVSDERITFFQVAPGALRRLSAPLSGHARLLVELLALGPRPLSRLAAQVAGRIGVEPPAAERLLHRALDLGLLVTAWRPGEFVAEPVQQAVADMEARGADAALAVLRPFQSDLERLRSGGADDAGAVVAVRQRLAARGDELSRLARRPAHLMVNEDFILDPLRVDPGTFEPALDDLAAVTTFLAAFDRMPVVRALLARALVDRFGPGCRVPLVEHAELLVRAVYRAEAVLSEHPDAPVGPTDASLSMLAKIRREALAAFGAGLAAGGHEACWSPGEVVDLVAGLPDRFRADPASYGLVVQPHRGDLIVNDAYAGHGPMVSRFLYADQVRGGDAAVRLRLRLPGLYGPAWRLLEDRGLHGLSMNAHPDILGEAVDPEGWSRLRLCHDAGSDSVSLVDADGAAVKVLALGAQLPELFPYPLRVASWLSSSGRVVLDIPGGQPRPADRTVAYPRARVGRVILSRRRWYPGADFPAPEADEVEHLVALAKWRGAHDVPPEVVLKSAFDGPTSWENLSAEGSREQFLELRRQSKPQYVDLASAAMVRVLPRLMQRRPSGYIEEARPALADGGHAREWMVEMTRPARATGFGWRS